MRIAVIIPARDEADRIGAVIAGVREHLPDAELWVIDDGSVDHTAALARSLGAQVIRQQAQGYPRAVQHGYEVLARHGYEAVVQLDADGQHPPSAAPRLLAALGSANIVFASRHGTNSPGTGPRKLANALLAAMVRPLTGLTLRDVTSGYWALDARAIDLLARELPPDIADANVRVLAARHALEIVEVPVRMPPRTAGRSMHDSWRGVINFGRSVTAVLRAARST